MKKKLIVTSAFLVLFLVIGSSFAIAVTESSEKDSFSIQHDSFMDGHIGGTNLGNAPQVNENLPSSYDLRTLNKVTPVKNQGKTNACWAFATYGSLESNLLPEENWNFSENHIKNLLSPVAPEGFDFDNNANGSSYLEPIAYLARWSGPVNATDDLYYSSSGYSPNEIGLPVQKHVQDVFILPARMDPLDNNEIKSVVMKYGAVATYIFVDNATIYSANNTTILDNYNSTTYSYYYNGSSNSTHGVDIVGWDDSFEKNNFSPVPPGNGAFIVRNSWGRQFGDNGYFYVSYYDSNIGKNNVVFTAENNNNYNYIYQYDPFGCTGHGFGYYNSTAWGANVFTSKSNEALKAVSFYTGNSSWNYEIYIYTNTDSNPINQVGPVLTQSGTIPYAGYHTIRLNSGVQLKAGQKFSIVLRLTSSQSNFPIAVEEKIPSYSIKATANPGESFVSPDGNTWTDITTLYPNTNVCIKAFTDSDSELPIQENSTQSLPLADFTSDVTSGGAPLSVQFTDLSQNETSRIWDFGDGSNSTEKNPEHTYNEVGTYTVLLKAINEAGSSTKTGVITVGSGSSSNTNTNTDTNSNNGTSISTDTGINSTKNETNSTNNGINDNTTACTETKSSSSNLVADFSTCVGALKVKFTDKSSGDTFSWKWDFGDGTYSTCKNPSHTYCKAGKYTVTLTIKDSEGNKKTKCKCVTVTDSSKKESSKNAKKVCKNTKKTSKNTKNTSKNTKRT